ncbi:acetyl-CoA carboxylase biotin carboxylase subunit family protein [Streptomyces sp. NPDC015131]|uniref:ATP-grasp domain-containing protein n=1 Tax=Streptomyces sp. NPDC015131 TaxID=3364941 RepID=UPI0036FEEE8A
MTDTPPGTPLVGTPAARDAGPPPVGTPAGLGAERVLMVLPSERLVRAAAAAGCRVWAVWDPALCPPAYPGALAPHCARLLPADLGDEAGLRALVARTVREHRITQVLHLGGASGVVPVLAEAQALGLGGNPAEALRLLGDRGAMRDLLRSHPRLRVRAERAAGTAAVRDAVARFAGAPVVIRSARVPGACRAALVRDVHGLDGWERAVAGRGTPGPFLVEEYLPGPQYAVDTLSVDGMHQVAGITATRTTGPPRFETVSHTHPAPLGDRAEAEIRSAVCALLDLAGFESGPAHTTVVRAPAGTRVLSARPGIGGDGIPRLVELAGGTDLEAEAFRALGGGLLRPTAARRTALAGFLPEGAASGECAAAALRALPYVHDVEVRSGRAPVRSRRALRVVVTGDGPGEAARHLAAARRLWEAGTGRRPRPVRTAPAAP